MLHQLMHVVCINLYITTNIICGETPYIVGVRIRVSSVLLFRCYKSVNYVYPGLTRVTTTVTSSLLSGRLLP